MHRSILSTVAALLATTTVACSIGPKVWTESQRTFRFPAASVKSVDVTTHNGKVHLSAADGDEAVVEATIRAGGIDEADAADCLANLELIVVEKDGVLVAKYNLPGKRSGWGVQVSFTVTQPAGAPTKVLTHNGKVVAQRIRADVELTTHNGQIKLEECSGAWNAHTHNGSIEASGRSSEINLRTHNGKVTVRVDGTGALSGKLVSHNGSITVDMVSDRDTEVNCETHNGGIDVSENFRTVHSKKRSYSGVLGAGGSKLSVETHNGNIRVD